MVYILRMIFFKILLWYFFFDDIVTERCLTTIELSACILSIHYKYATFLHFCDFFSSYFLSLATRAEGPSRRTPPGFHTGTSTGTPVPTASAVVGVAATSSTSSSCSRTDNSSVPWTVNRERCSAGPRTDSITYTFTDQTQLFII